MDKIQCPKCFAQNPIESPYCNQCGADLEENKDTLSYRFSDFAQAEKEIQFSSGDEFGERYRIIEEIGRGGMGRVYKAKDLELEITVAIKLIRPKYSSNPHFVEMFKRETLTARSISHENVVRIHDLGEAGNIKYISMEYIKGQNLRDLIRTSGSLTIKKTVDIARQLCQALDAAHQKGIIHRDLKPSNIMIDNNGRVHVMDFGLATSFLTRVKESAGPIIGTLQYLSPEQAGGKKLDQRSDIYAFGLVLYEMLTGKPAFTAEDAQGYIHKQLNEAPQKPSELNALIPAYLQRLVLKCLEKRPDDRYQNIGTICRDLDRNHDLLVFPRKPAKKNRIWKYALPLIILLAAIFSYPIIKKYLDSVFSESNLDFYQPLSEIGTDDPMAKQLFIDAKSCLEDRKWKEAIDLLEKAVAADPEFAMAYKEIAMAYDYLHSPLKTKEYMIKALALLHKVTRREQFLINGYGAILMDKSPQKAKGIYLNLLREYPNDEEGLRMLASIYRNLEEWDEAIEQYEKIKRINSKVLTVYDNLFYVYMARGLYAEARNILAESQVVFPSQARVYRLTAHTYICQRKFDQARREVDKANSVDPNNSIDARLLGNIYHIEGKIELAEKYYSTLITKTEPDWQVIGHMWLGNLSLRQGRFRKSEANFNRGLTISQKMGLPADELDFRLALAYLKMRNGNYSEMLQDLDRVIDFTLTNDLPKDQKRALFLRGLAYAALNQFDYAHNTLDELEELIEKKGYPKEKRLFFLLKGIVLQKEKKTTECLDFLKRACELLPSEVFNLRNQAFYYDFLAHAYYISGDMENSRKQYEKITALTMGMLEWGDIYVRSFYMLGRIHEASGRKEEARQNYETFLRLWKEADPELPEIAQAGVKLQELE